MTSYSLYLDDTELVSLNPSLNYYTLNSLTLGQKLKLQVSAHNNVGESILSKSNSITFANVPSEPQQVTLETMDDLSTMRVMWTAPVQANGDAIHGYKVYVDDGIGGPYSLVFDGSNYPNTYQNDIFDLKCGFNYYVQVSAINVAGEGPSTTAKLWHGLKPSEPLNPKLV